MKTILIGPEREENLGLRYLAGSLQAAGHDCTILSSDREEAACRSVALEQPALVGLALVSQHSYPAVQRLAEALRSQGYRGHLTTGGHFASLRSEEVLRDTPGLDSVLHHDAEERIVSLARWLDTGGEEPPAELEGITWRCGSGLRHRPPLRVAAIDSLPRPIRRAPDRWLGHAMAPLVASRGCVRDCSFCSIHAWHRQVPGARLRLRAPGPVATEMVDLHHEHGVQIFLFHDDDFVHPERLKALARCQSILEPAAEAIGPIALVIKVRPDDVSEPLFRYLQSMGLVRVYVGIESFARSGLAALNRRVTPEQTENALRILRELGVYATFNLLLFHPDSTAAEVEENLAFLERHLDFPFEVARTELYARSSLEQQMLRAGRALGDYRGHDYRIADPVAEACFQLFSGVLWEREFGDGSVVHRVQGVGFGLSLLERFHPGHATPELRDRCRALVREVNLDTLQYLQRFLACAREVGEAASWDAVARLRAELEPRIRARTRDQAKRCTALMLELEGRAALDHTRAERLPARSTSPRLWSRLASVGSGLTLVLGTACDFSRSVAVDLVPPPFCNRSVALETARTLGPGALARAPFEVPPLGLTQSLDVTVDWADPASRIAVFVARGSCSQEQLAAGSCTLVARSESGPQPRRLALAIIPSGAYELLVLNTGEDEAQVSAQVVLSQGGACPPLASVP